MEGNLRMPRALSNLEYKGALCVRLWLMDCTMVASFSYGKDQQYHSIIILDWSKSFFFVTVLCKKLE